MANFPHYLHGWKRPIKTIKPAVDLNSVGQRLQMFNNGLEVCITDDELTAFENALFVTDIGGMITNNPEWQKLEDENAFARLATIIRQVRQTNAYLAKEVTAARAK